MGAVRDLVEELRRRGVTVHEWPGWDGRGNADGGVGPRIPQIDPVGAVIHHTASAYGSAYAGLVSSTRPELLGGCLCNFAGNDDGSLTVVASGLAWHAGPGVGPSLGRVLSKVPNIRSLMNRLTVGLEIVYPGDQPMRPAQYRTALIFSRTVADLFADGDIECVRAHFETNGAVPGGAGKWDPGYAPGKSIDMAAFRRDAAAVRPGATAPEEEPEMLIISAPNRGVALVGPGVYAGLRTDEEVKTASGFLDLPVCSGNDRQFDVARSIALRMQGSSDVLAKLNDLAARVAGIGTADVDEQALAGLLAPKLAGVTAAQVADALRQVLREGVGNGAA